MCPSTEGINVTSSHFPWRFTSITSAVTYIIRVSNLIFSYPASLNSHETKAQLRTRRPAVPGDAAFSMCGGKERGSEREREREGERETGERLVMWELDCLCGHVQFTALRALY